MTENTGSSNKKTRSLYSELVSGFSATTTETRAENAFSVAVKFMSLLETQVKDEEQRKKLMSAWYKSVRDNDFRKFKRSLRRYNKWVVES